MTRPPADLRLYLVTDTRLCAGLGVVETVRRAVAGGVTIVQLRDPAAGDEQIVELGRALVAVLEPAGVPLIVNDRVHLVEAIGAQGAHVGQDDLDPVAARAILGPGAILGLSVHDRQQLDAAGALPPGTIDHLGIGPLRHTSSKLDHAPVCGLEHLRDLAAASPWPCVAIGGVTVADLPDLRAAGLAGVAVISAICGTPDPTASAAQLRAAWDSDAWDADAWNSVAWDSDARDSPGQGASPTG